MIQKASWPLNETCKCKTQIIPLTKVQKVVDKKLLKDQVTGTGQQISADR